MFGNSGIDKWLSWQRKLNSVPNFKFLRERRLGFHHIHMPPKEMFPLMKVQKENSKKENSPPFLVLQNQSSHKGLLVLEGLLQGVGGGWLCFIVGTRTLAAEVLGSTPWREPYRFVFVSIQPVCVFWLGHLIHLHSMLLSICMFLLPFS